MNLYLDDDDRFDDVDIIEGVEYHEDAFDEWDGEEWDEFEEEWEEE